LYFDAYSDNKSNGAFILMMQQTQRRELAFINPHPAFPGEIIDKRVDISLSVRELKNDVKLVIDYKSE
jgi:hypothetical protein